MPDQSDADELLTIVDEEPKAAIGALAMMSKDSDFGRDELLAMAEILSSEGVNLFRILNEHPEETEKLLGVGEDFSESFVEEFD